MIRLGSLAGYPFEGPRVLAGWTPPAVAAVYAILCKDSSGEQYAVIFVGESDDLSREHFPFNHPRAGCWVKRAGDRFKLSICTYEVPGGLPSHREQIVRELAAIYHPSCNADQYDAAWKDEWIGEYTRPHRRPAQHRRDATPAARAGSRPLRGSASGGCLRPAWPGDARHRAPEPGRSRRRRCPRPCRTATAARRR